MVVDLPAPFAPTKPNISPGRTVKPIPSRACLPPGEPGAPPKCLRRSLISNIRSSPLPWVKSGPGDIRPGSRGNQRPGVRSASVTGDICHYAEHMTRADKDKPVVLSRIYTRTGDDGTTTLGDMSRTAKTDTRLAAYADVEEANAHLGLALSHGTLPGDLVPVLRRVQNELFDLGADLSTPVTENPEFPPLRVEQSYIDWLEEQCDLFNARLKPLRSFILPGGDPAAAA